MTRLNKYNESREASCESKTPSSKSVIHSTLSQYFVQNVLDVVSSIPEGRATSYGAIARAIGHPRLSRAVGRVLGGKYGETDGVPAHRVVNSQGILTARDAFGRPGRMQELLENEGVSITNNRICNWKSVFWDPLEEINI